MLICSQLSCAFPARWMVGGVHDMAQLCGAERFHLWFSRYPPNPIRSWLGTCYRAGLTGHSLASGAAHWTMNTSLASWLLDKLWYAASSVGLRRTRPPIKNRIFLLAACADQSMPARYLARRVGTDTLDWEGLLVGSVFVSRGFSVQESHHCKKDGRCHT